MMAPESAPERESIRQTVSLPIPGPQPPIFDEVVPGIVIHSTFLHNAHIQADFTPIPERRLTGIRISSPFLGGMIFFSRISCDGTRGGMT